MNEVQIHNDTTPDDRFKGFEIPAEIRQIIFVKTASWNANSGELECWEWTNSKWERVLGPYTCQLGGRGLAWGTGSLVDIGVPTTKVEGDRRSPAGMFPIGFAFGTAKHVRTKLHYRQMTECDYWVDATDSLDYNQLKRLPPHRNFPQQHWNSFEPMVVPGPYYQRGIVVEYNTNPTVPGRGSAIFIHANDTKRSLTMGCTALQMHEIERILAWLNRWKHPVLFQIPAGLTKQ